MSWEDHVNAPPTINGYRKEQSWIECPICHREVAYLVGKEDPKTHKPSEGVCEECFQNQKTA
jgi:hypothetical protein